MRRREPVMASCSIPDSTFVSNRPTWTPSQEGIELYAMKQTELAVPGNRTRDLPKSLTGIRGLDDITLGGLPQGRPTLVCGGPGSGKTLLGLTFLVNGTLRFAEPGVLMTFEENAEEVASDVASLGFDLPDLISTQKLVVDYVRVERSE